MWDVLARVAELELRIITKRHADARAVVRENGAFAGKPPCGFEPVGERYNKRLQLRADLAPVLREMVDPCPAGRHLYKHRRVAGRVGDLHRSRRSLVADLRADRPGFPSPEGPLPASADGKVLAPLRRADDLGSVGGATGQP